MTKQEKARKEKEKLLVVAPKGQDRVKKSGSTYKVPNYRPQLLCPGDGVHFDDPSHTYTNKDGVKYTSGTTLVHKFIPEFQSDFWKELKAYEPILKSNFLAGEDLNRLNTYRKIPGWRSLQYKDPKATLWTLLMAEKLCGLAPEKVLDRARQQMKDLAPDFDREAGIAAITAEWKAKTLEATTKGTAFHQREEDKLKERTKFYEDWNMVDITAGKVPPGQYPEMIIYNHQFGVAGMADRVKINSDNSVILGDYKTTSRKNMFEENFVNPYTGQPDSMLAPIQELENTTLVHYTLQMSLYGWMLERHGYKVDRMYILWVEQKEGNDYAFKDKKLVELCYTPNAIERMLRSFKPSVRKIL